MVDDLSVSVDIFPSVIQGMPFDLRQLVSHASLSLDVDHDEVTMRVLRNLSHLDRFALQEELDCGDCFVVDLGSGPQRVRTVVVLNVVCTDGRQLVELGMPCHLPTARSQERETAEETLQRFTSL